MRRAIGSLAAALYLVTVLALDLAMMLIILAGVFISVGTP